ncbi:hypothetical protein V6N11_018995 [Hibiscus sabdariffa]|uniref:Uncharacterized protein n=1 Tax=Hibiscus sabdariffa TaxID=183260 RepID=A0ABR2R155_9ROSI
MACADVFHLIAPCVQIGDRCRLGPSVIGSVLALERAQLGACYCTNTNALLAAANTSVSVNLPDIAQVEKMSPTKGDATDNILASTSPVDVNNKVPMVTVFESPTNESFGSTMVPTLNNVGEGGLDYDLGKSFLATPNMLVMFDAWISNQSSSHTATIDEGTPLLISRGAKRRLSMQHDSKTKKPRPPPNISKTRAGMSSVKNSSAEVVSQPRRGK